MSSSCADVLVVTCTGKEKCTTKIFNEKSLWLEIAKARFGMNNSSEFSSFFDMLTCTHTKMKNSLEFLLSVLKKQICGIFRA